MTASKGIFSIVLVFFLTTACENRGKDLSHLRGAVTGNNSSDVIKALFSDARSIAYNIVSTYDFSVWNYENTVTQFMRENDLSIANEINSIQFIWGDFDQSACATTNGSKGDPIYLNYSVCRNSVKNLDDAIRIIIHESIHHHGIGSSPSDEAFADTAAGNYIRASTLVQNRTIPLFSSIVYSSTSGSYGVTANYGSIESGQEKARKFCGDQCDFYQSVANSCIVLYADVNNPKNYSWWHNEDLNLLRSKTKEHCENTFHNACKEVGFSCSSRKQAPTVPAAQMNQTVQIKNSIATRCLGPFIIESKQSYSLADFNSANKGKVSFGIYRELKTDINSTIAYSTIDPSDPILEEMNDVFNRGAKFEACIEDRIAKEFDKDASCKTCTARGEIQEDIKIFSIVIKI